MSKRLLALIMSLSLLGVLLGSAMLADSAAADSGPDWVASYFSVNAPTSWVQGQSQSWNVSVQNIGNQLWHASGTNQVKLGVHFMSSSGSWYTNQNFGLQYDVYPGNTTSIPVSVTPPAAASGPMVLQVQMMYGLNWFSQVANTNVYVDIPAWIGLYPSVNPPASWVQGQSQSWIITVQNVGNQVWNAGGTDPVHLGIHFMSQGGTWYTDQRFILPGDVHPGASATVPVTVSPPTNASGPMVLEVQLVKEYEFWFQQFVDTATNVPPGPGARYAASLDVSGTPTTWASGQTRTYSLAVTNTGNQYWAGAPQYPAELRVGWKKPTGVWVGGGTAVFVTGDVAPGASLRYTVSVTPPSGSSGPMIVETKMTYVLGNTNLWLGGMDVNVTVQPPPTVTVPNVVGASLSAAQSAIRGAGLTVGTVTGGPGVVVSQSPAAGAKVSPGSAVNLTLKTPPPSGYRAVNVYNTNNDGDSVYVHLFDRSTGSWSDEDTQVPYNYYYVLTLPTSGHTYEVFAVDPSLPGCGSDDVTNNNCVRDILPAIVANSSGPAYGWNLG